MTRKKPSGCTTARPAAGSCRPTSRRGRSTWRASAATCKSRRSGAGDAGKRRAGKHAPVLLEAELPGRRRILARPPLPSRLPAAGGLLPRPRRAGRGTPAGLLLEVVDLLRRLGLGHLLGDLLTGLAGQRMDVGVLRPG